MTSCQPCSGVCAQHQTVQPDSLRSSSYTAPRQSSPPRVRCTSMCLVHRGRSQASQRRRRRSKRGSKLAGRLQVGNLSAEIMPLPQQKDPPLAFREGDLVLRRIQQSAGQHKLSSPWEGPFVVSRALRNNSYYLVDCTQPSRHKDTSGVETERPWSAELLCPFYS